jgi:hypothetical protein
MLLEVEGQLRREDRGIGRRAGAADEQKCEKGEGKNPRDDATEIHAVLRLAEGLNELRERAAAPS